jgi:hypothetical protein
LAYLPHRLFSRAGSFRRTKLRHYLIERALAPPRGRRLNTEFKALSDAVYSQSFRGVFAEGDRSTPERITSGRRHYEDELRLRLIDQGVRIVAGQPSV